jgi:CRP-like cAMP-binding protein
MPKDLFAELDAIAISTPVQKGSSIFSLGDLASAVYVVRSGNIALVWIDHEVYPMETLGPGSIIGLPAVLNGQYSTDAWALEDSELGFIPASRVMEMLERNPSHMHATVMLLALEVARIREMIAKPLSFGTVGDY